MPKLRLTYEQKKIAQEKERILFFRAAYKAGLTEMELTRKKLENEINMPTSTMTSKLKDPRTFSVSEFASIANILEFDAATICKMIGVRYREKTVNCPNH